MQMMGAGANWCVDALSFKKEAQSQCDQVAFYREQARQLRGMAKQARLGSGSGVQAAFNARMRQLRTSSAVRARSIEDYEFRYRARETIVILVNVCLTALMVFWLIRKVRARHMELQAAAVNLGIIETARRDAAIAGGFAG